jgi:phosphoribosylformimino-5-aminoimidazole carboxamide ribotide isomerase
MLVIPAIDIMSGKCVRLRQGRFTDSTVFFDDPVTVARTWAAQGASLIHVVDLDGTRTGQPAILDLLPQLAAVGVPIEVGGGMRSVENIRAALTAGATRISPGSRIATDPAFAREVITEFGEHIAVDIAGRNGLVAIHGWQEIINKSVIDLAKEVAELGAARIIFTDVSRDGMLEGPNFAALKEMVAAVSIPIVASGGITSVADVRYLATTGVEACIIGRALYSGDIELSAAIAAAQE